MLGTIIVILAVVGAVATLADIFLTSDQKKRFGKWFDWIWYQLAKLREAPIVSATRGFPLFCAIIGIELIIFFAELYEPRDIIWNAGFIAFGVLTAPMVWYITYANSLMSFLVRALLTFACAAAASTFAWFIFKGQMQPTQLDAIFKTEPAVILAVVVMTFFSYVIVLAPLPKPLAYLLTWIIAALEFMFRRCIESSKGGALAFFTIMGCIGGVIKAFTT